MPPWEVAAGDNHPVIQPSGRAGCEPPGKNVTLICQKGCLSGILGIWAASESWMSLCSPLCAIHHSASDPDAPRQVGHAWRRMHCRLVRFRRVGIFSDKGYLLAAFDRRRESEGPSRVIHANSVRQAQDRTLSAGSQKKGFGGYVVGRRGSSDRGLEWYSGDTHQCSHATRSHKEELGCPMEAVLGPEDEDRVPLFEVM